MNPGPQLRDDQRRRLEVLHARWMKSVYATAPANRAKAEDGVRQTCRAAGVHEPELFLWFDDLLGAALAAEQLGPLVESNWMLPPKALAPRLQVQRTLRKWLGLRTWRQVMKAVGPRQTRSRPSERQFFSRTGPGEKVYRIGVALRNEASLQAGLPPYDPASPDAGPACDELETVARELDRAAGLLRNQQREFLSCYMGPGRPGRSSLDLLSPLFERDYPFGFLARHEFLSKVCGVRSSVAYAGLCKTAHHCAAWWAFANAAVLAERPSELHLDDDGRLHNTAGPAIVYRSGLQLYAEHGSFRLPSRTPARRTAASVPRFPDQRLRSRLLPGCASTSRPERPEGVMLTCRGDDIQGHTAK